MRRNMYIDVKAISTSFNGIVIIFSCKLYIKLIGILLYVANFLFLRSKNNIKDESFYKYLIDIILTKYFH